MFKNAFDKKYTKMVIRNCCEMYKWKKPQCVTLFPKFELSAFFDHKCDLVNRSNEQAKNFTCQFRNKNSSLNRHRNHLDEIKCVFRTLRNIYDQIGDKKINSCFAKTIIFQPLTIFADASSQMFGSVLLTSLRDAQ